MAKTRATGADVQLLGALEATYGTPPDGAGGGVYTKLTLRETTLGAVKPLAYDPLLGQGRDALDPYYEASTDDGDIIVPIDVQGFGWWSRGLFGAPTTTGTGPYTHVYTTGADLPSVALEIGHVKLSTPKFERHKGVKFGALAFEMARSGAANATLSLVAQGETNPTTASDASPTSYTLTRFNRSRGTIKIGGSPVASVTGGRIAFSNNLDPAETMTDDGLIEGIDDGEATATGSITARFGVDSTISDAIDAETPLVLQYEFTRPTGGHTLTFDLPRVFFAWTGKEIRGPGGIERTYDWRAAKDSVAGHLMQVTLVNDVASY